MKNPTMNGDVHISYWKFGDFPACHSLVFGENYHIQAPTSCKLGSNPYKWPKINCLFRASYWINWFSGAHLEASQNPSPPWILWNSIWYSKARACCHCPLLPHALTTAPLELDQTLEKKHQTRNQPNMTGWLGGLFLGKQKLNLKLSQKPPDPSLSLGWCLLSTREKS